jgi:SSS family solute:Na+ symporter
VVEIWYTIGSLFIPGIILPVVSAYYPKFRISYKLILTEIILAVCSSTFWLELRNTQEGILSEIEPMIIGLTVALLIHGFGLLRKSFSLDQG